MLINGATGITGQVAVQIAQHLGAGRVIATGRDATALARLAELGADDTVDLTLEPDALHAALRRHTGDLDVVLDYLAGSPTEAVLAAIAGRHKRGAPLRYVVAGAAAGAALTVPTSVLATTPIHLMGSGIGALQVPELLQAAADVLQIASTTELHIDVDERPLSQVAESWAATQDRRRVVFTP